MEYRERVVAYLRFVLCIRQSSVTFTQENISSKERKLVFCKDVESTAELKSCFYNDVTESVSRCKREADSEFSVSFTIRQLGYVLLTALSCYDFARSGAASGASKCVFYRGYKPPSTKR